MQAGQVGRGPWHRVVVMDDPPHGWGDALLIGSLHKIGDKLLIADAWFSIGPRRVDLVSHGSPQIKGGNGGNGGSQRMARQDQSVTTKFLNGRMDAVPEFLVGFGEPIVGLAANAPLGTGQVVEGPRTEHGE